MYEHRSQPLLPRGSFVLRLLKHSAVSLGLILISLGIGILGYHFFEGLSWLDSLLNASMILGGMGPIDRLYTDTGKVFASFYALFAGIVFLTSAGIIMAPVAHRILHYLNLQENER